MRSSLFLIPVTLVAVAACTSTYVLTGSGVSTVLTESGPAVALSDAEVGGLVWACAAQARAAKGSATAKPRIRANRRRVGVVFMRLVS